LEFGVWSWELGVGSWELGVGSWELGVGSLEFGVWSLETLKFLQFFKDFPIEVNIASNSSASVISSSVLEFSIQPNSLIISNQ